MAMEAKSISSSPGQVMVKMNGSTGSNSYTKSSLVVYPPTRKGMPSNEVITCSPAIFPNPKRRRTSEYEMTTELIKSEIFAYGKKPEIKLTLFSEMYSCSNCCELFYTEMGLREHQQREIFSVTLDCPHCPLKKAFANRCQILNHLKSHGITPTVESLRGVISFGPLPEGRDFHDYSIIIPTRHPGHVPTAPTTIIPSQLDVTKTELQKTGIFLRGERQYKIIPVSNTQKNTTPSTTITTLTSTTNEPSPSGTAIPERLAPKYAKDFFCAACGSNFTDGSDFVDHIKLSNLSSSELTVCPADGVPTRSQCERHLHTRVFHDKEPPFVCPECGIQFPDFVSLGTHDESECFHLSRAVIYSCIYNNTKNTATNGAQDGPPKSSCGNAGKFPNTSLLIKHLEQHWRDIHKCNSCPQALLSAELLEKHVEAMHKDDEVTLEQKGLNFVQCLVCNVIFFTRTLFLEHFLSKLKEHSITTLGFHCAKCSHSSENSKQFSSHVCKSGHGHTAIASSNHLVQKRIEVSRMSLLKPSSASVTTCVTTNSPLMTNTASTNTNSFGHRCVYCKKAYPTVRTLKRHQPNCDLKSIVQQRRPANCKICSKTLQGSKSFLAHGITHLNAGMNICLYCNNKKLEDSDDLDGHLITHVKAIKSYPHECRFCDESVGDRDEAHEHFASHHEKTSNCFKCATCGDHFNSVPELTTHKTTAHSAQVAAPAPIKNGSGSSNRNRVVRPAFSYSYQCKYCPDRKFQTRPGLRKHLRNHHTDIDFTAVDWNEMRRITRTSATSSSSSPATASVTSKRSVRDRARDRRSSNAANRTAPPSIIGTHLHSSGKPFFDPEPSERSARTEDGKFRCLKCEDGLGLGEEEFESESEFYEHIREIHVWEEMNPDQSDSDTNQQSQPRDQSYWCPECGLEFVAKPSFRMHLQFAHPFIKNVAEYLDNIGYGKEKPLKENQCSVCRLQCPSADEYESHIRTHGMAFLRQRIQRPSV